MNLSKAAAAVSRHLLMLSSPRIGLKVTQSSLPTTACFGMSSGTSTRAYRNAWGDSPAGATLLQRPISEAIGCPRRMVGVAAGIHTQGDKELVDFLSEEVKAEKKLERLPKHGPGVPGFVLSLDGSNVTLTRKFKTEEVVVRLNVNGSVDYEEGPEDDFPPGGAGQGQEDAPVPGDMKSKPRFVVEIKKPSTGRTLVFNCHLYGDGLEGEEEPPQAEQSAKGDKYEIESFAILEEGDTDPATGEWSDSLYSGDGGIIDGQMYDLLMNYLEERGVGVEFAEALVEFSTYYEHKQYLNLLENLKSFLEAK